MTNRIVRYFVSLLITTCFLISCSQVPVNNFGTTITGDDDSALWQPLTEDTQYYLSKASASKGAESHSYQLYAVQRMIQSGNVTQAEQLLSSIKIPSTENTLDARKKLLQSHLALLDNQAVSALNILQSINDPTSLPLIFQVQYHKLRANAYDRSGNLYASIAERVSLDPFLKSEKAKQNNQNFIWRELHKMDTTTLNAKQQEATSQGDERLAGWLKLAYIDQAYQNDNATIVSEIKQWQQQYPGHSAGKMLPVTLVADNQYYDNSSGKRIVLMLPLHGRLGKAGKAVRDGFMAEYYKNKQQSRSQQAISVVDTSVTYDIVGLHRDAVKNGATIIIGPLSKENVETLSQQNSLGVPTLALNYNQRDFNPSPNLYQFGLSPLDEATQAASRAWQENHSRAIIITPNSKWGEQVAAAFTRQFNNEGGVIVDNLSYKHTRNLTNAIKSLLQVDESAERAQEVERTTHQRIEFVPRRRQDFDMFFLVANPKMAKQIRPLLKFYYAGDVPIYATSSIYSGIPTKRINHDLDDIIFSDIPWVLRNTAQANAEERHLAHLWPNQYNHYVRLYALGMDAYTISQKLNRLNEFPQFSVAGATGYLTLDQKQRVHRKLEWAYMRNGMPVSLSHGQG